MESLPNFLIVRQALSFVEDMRFEARAKPKLAGIPKAQTKGRAINQYHIPATLTIYHISLN